MLEAFRRLGIGGEADGDNFPTVAPVAMEDDDTALFRLTDTHDAEVETICRKAQIVAYADGELLQQGFFGTDARARQGELDGLVTRAVYQGSSLFELAALAAWVEAECDAGGVAGFDSLPPVKPNGGAAAGGIALHEGYSLLSGVAQAERLFPRAIGFLDGAERQGGKADDDERIRYHVRGRVI